MSGGCSSGAVMNRSSGTGLQGRVDDTREGGARAASNARADGVEVDCRGDVDMTGEVVVERAALKARGSACGSYPWNDPSSSMPHREVARAIAARRARRS